MHALHKASVNDTCNLHHTSGFDEGLWAKTLPIYQPIITTCTNTMSITIVGITWLLQNKRANGSIFLHATRQVKLFGLMMKGLHSKSLYEYFSWAPKIPPRSNATSSPTDFPMCYIIPCPLPFSKHYQIISWSPLAYRAVPSYGAFK